MMKELEWPHWGALCIGKPRKGGILAKETIASGARAH